MEITREGKGLLLTTVLVSLAALNTGNNLIYLLLALMIALLLIDVVSGFRNLARLDGTAEVDGTVHATQPAGLTFRIRNRRKRRHAFLVATEWKMIDGKAMIPRVEASGQSMAEAVVRFPRRGYYQLKDGQLKSGFPFGFVRFSRPMTTGRKILVYPALLDVRAVLSRVSRSGGSGLVPLSGGDDFTDLRPYRPGDPMKDIHWKVTAKTGEMVVREYRAGVTHRVNLVLDTAPGATSRDFERGVSMAASLALELISQGLTVKLTTGSGSSDYCANRETVCRILDMLAVIQPDTRTRIPRETDTNAINLLVLCRQDSPYASLQSGMTETIHVHSV